jgi:hypothetical protein
MLLVCSVSKSGGQVLQLAGNSTAPLPPLCLGVWHAMLNAASTSTQPKHTQYYKGRTPCTHLCMQGPALQLVSQQRSPCYQPLPLLLPAKQEQPGKLSSRTSWQS